MESAGPSSHNIRLVLEYNGAGFCGWQMQPGLRSVQSELDRVLRMVLRSPIGALHVAGRTDAGVHARQQVVNFSLETQGDQLPDLSRMAYSVSSILGGEVSVLFAEEVSPHFHSRTAAEFKQYSYRMVVRDAPLVLDKGRVWRIGTRLDVARMQEEAPLLRGTHDFSSYRAGDCSAASPVREITESELIVEWPYLTYRVVGRGFLKQMVRNIVGTLVGLARSSSHETLATILKKCDRAAALTTAPAQGLYLDWIHYPEPYTLPAPYGQPSMRIRP